jgi:hypothetical protein
MRDYANVLVKKVLVIFGRNPKNLPFAGGFSAIRREFLPGSHILIATRRRAKVYDLAPVAQRNRSLFCHVNSTNRVAHQAPRGGYVLHLAVVGVRAPVWRIQQPAHQPRNRPAQQRHAPDNH